jgi:glyoxylase-like metal-dependent hydrolase (beta-lactamase superfamily II)
MAQQIPLDACVQADDPQRDDARGDGTSEIRPDLAYRRLAIVNVIFYGPPAAGDRGWVLVDAGLFGTKRLITSAAAERFGENARPAAIVLTHGHFDHVGVLEDLAHGTASYPPPDPKVGGGLMALSSPLFPRGPVDVAGWLQPLPPDGSVPHMPGWRWIHVPGHAPGQVALWRESDRSLVAGDAFVTTRQESVYAALTQEAELHGPPMYYTPDWERARESVRRLAALEPELAVTGHGRAMRGAVMREALRLLARDFDRIALPKQGRYRDEPARAEDGSAYRRP